MNCSSSVNLVLAAAPFSRAATVDHLPPAYSILFYNTNPNTFMNLLCGPPLWFCEYMPIKCGLVSSPLDGAELITTRKIGFLKCI